MMKFIDVFNGDADGLCALVQLRRATPVESQLVTGIKRKINLLSDVVVDKGDKVTVLDISFDKNATDVKRILECCASVFYVDHHQADQLFEHDKLDSHINLASDTCTSLIVDKLLNGRYRTWAITAAFGDNLSRVADGLAKKAGLDSEQIEQLKTLGILLNYNGYGASLDDLFFDPADLFSKMKNYDCPFLFLKNEVDTFSILEDGYLKDMEMANQVSFTYQTEKVGVIELPSERWARRVSGVFSNELANSYPDRAHAVLTKNSTGGFLVSVRAPLNNKSGADQIVSQFPTGGGRKAAGGINHLPVEQLEKLVNTMENQYQM